MSGEIRILRPTFHPSPLPLEFLVQVVCNDCGQPPRTISLTRDEAEALHVALHTMFLGIARYPMSVPVPVPEDQEWA